MTKPSDRFPKAAVALLVALFAVLGTSDGSALRREKRVVPTVRGPSRPFRVLRPPVRRRGSRYASDRVLLRFRPGVDETYAEGLLRSYGFPLVRRIAGIGVYCVKTVVGMSVTETLAMLERNADIDTARPDYRLRLADIPNDPYFLDYQYALRNIGATIDISPEIQLQTTAGADIKATTAWDVAKGDPETIIAVIDTGVDMSHPDLAAKIVPGGRDFGDDDDDPTDTVWHGTNIAGIAAANTNNSVGTAGVAWDCRILPVKVIDAAGDIFESYVIDAIIWATDQGADVLNISLGGPDDVPYLEEACKYAHDKGVVVVAAAGNDGISMVQYPAAYDAYVLAVAASDYNDAIADFSSFGPEVDVAAPGVWILGPAPQSYVGEGNLPYVFASGTSMAAPHVAGMAALIKSAKPDLTADEVMNIIRYTADDVNKAAYPGRDDHAGYGRINMERALVPYILK